MKKSIKGALAAGGAAVLLMGGAGTLAYWTDNATVGGTSFETGELKLVDDVCGDWTLVNKTTSVPFTGQKLVPGDSLNRACTYKVVASGANLTATLTTPSAVATGTLTGATGVSLPVTSTYKLGTATLGASSTITSSDDTKVLTATFKVDFPFGTADTTVAGVNGNDTQAKAASLADLSVTLVQNQLP